MIGDIILIRTNSWFGRNIRKVTKGYYNHVGIFVAKDKIVEASMWGVKLVSIEKFNKQKDKGHITYNIFRIKNTTDQQKLDMVNFALSKVGSPYDFIQLFSLLYIFLNHKNRNLEPIDVPMAYICSELVASAVDNAGLCFNENIDKDCISPTDIAQSQIVEMVE